MERGGEPVHARRREWTPLHDSGCSCGEPRFGVLSDEAEERGAARGVSPTPPAPLRPPTASLRVERGGDVSMVGVSIDRRPPPPPPPPPPSPPPPPAGVVCGAAAGWAAEGGGAPSCAASSSATSGVVGASGGSAAACARSSDACSSGPSPPSPPSPTSAAAGSAAVAALGSGCGSTSTAGGGSASPAHASVASARGASPGGWDADGVVVVSGLRRVLLRRGGCSRMLSRRRPGVFGLGGGATALGAGLRMHGICASGGWPARGRRLVGGPAALRGGGAGMEDCRRPRVFAAGPLRSVAACWRAASSHVACGRVGGPVRDGRRSGRKRRTRRTSSSNSGSPSSDWPRAPSGVAPCSRSHKLAAEDWNRWIMLMGWG